MRTMSVAVALLAVLWEASVAFGQGDLASEAYRAQVSAAEKSLRLGETRELRAWLDACDPSMRGWEWHHLNAVADARVQTIDRPVPPAWVAASPSGDRLASVEGSRVLVLSWPSCDEVAVIDGHTDTVYRAAFSPDGERIVTVARDVTSRVWDARSGAEIARIELSNPAVAAAAFSDDGTRAATCAWERDETGAVHGVVWVWDPATGVVHHRERVGDKPISSVDFLPNAGIVVGSWDGLVHVLDSTAREVRRLELPDEGVYNAVDDVAVLGGGGLVAAASKDRTVRVFDVESGELVATLDGHNGYVGAVSLSPDGGVLASASIDTTVSLWSTHDWSRRAVLRGPSESVSGVAWADGGRTLTAATRDGGLAVFEADPASPAVRTISTGYNGVYSCELSADGATIAVACFDGWLRLYDARDGSLVREWEAHAGSTCHAAAFDSAGRRLVTASWDRTARVWDPRTGEEIARLEGGGGVYSAVISPDGLNAALSADGLQIWDVDAVERRHTLVVEGATPRRLAFSEDGQLVVSGWTDGYARVLRVDDGTLVAELGDGGSGVESAAFFGADARIATGNRAGVVRTFSLADGQELSEADTGGRAVNRVAAFGDRLAVATDRVWILDADRGRTVTSLLPHDDTVWSLCWGPSGDRLVTCAIAGEIKIMRR